MLFSFTLVYGFYAVVLIFGPSFFYLEVTPEGITTRFLGVTQKAVWKDIAAISMAPFQARLIGYGVWLIGRIDKPSLVVPAGLYSNRNELIKAMMEALRKARPFAGLDEEFLERYGDPPYGIFAKAKS